MGNVQILSTLQNKAAQKKAIYRSSSTVFFAVFNPNIGIDTEVSLLNHFILKRGITDVIASVEIRDLRGNLFHSFKLSMNEELTYSVRLSDHIESEFLGSIYIFFNSNENLAVPFCAVMCSIKSPNSVCGVHTYGRRLEQKELGSNLDMQNSVETGWTARDNKSIKSFAVLHGGAFKLNLKFKLEISNHLNQVLTAENESVLEPFGSLLIIPQDYSNKVISHLDNKKGHIKVYIDGLSGIFPRMMCGNFSSNDLNDNTLTNAHEIQFTHTNFDFASIEQPDAGGSLGYYNQPSIPEGYGIVYPVKTKKAISIAGENYQSNTMHRISVDKMSQVEIISDRENLPSRFVAAAVGSWDGAKLESECSTGTFIEDYLKVPCHWHWGLLKPGLENGESIISVILNSFNRNEDLKRILKLRLFDEERLLVERDLIIEGHLEFNVMDILPRKLPDGAIWYVLSGDCLEDLNIFSTFYPKDKAGFTEHAF